MRPRNGGRFGGGVATNNVGGGGGSFLRGDGKTPRVVRSGGGRGESFEVVLVGRVLKLINGQRCMLGIETDEFLGENKLINGV